MRLALLVILGLLSTSSLSGFSAPEIPKQPATTAPGTPPDAKTEYVDPETGAVCVTRPGKVEPLVLTPVKDSAYYQFLQDQNQSWLGRWMQKVKTFFHRINPWANHAS